MSKDRLYSIESRERNTSDLQSVQEAQMNSLKYKKQSTKTGKINKRDAAGPIRKKRPGRQHVNQSVEFTSPSANEKRSKQSPHISPSKENLTARKRDASRKKSQSPEQ